MIKNTAPAFAGLILATFAAPAEAQNTRSFRCDDGLRPFTVRVTVVDQRTISVNAIDGRVRTLRITQQREGERTYAGGADNEYNMTFNARQGGASLNKPNSETIECPLVNAAQAQPRPSPGPGAVDPGRKPAWCAKPANPAQETVCDSAELSSLDGVVGVAYRRAVSDSGKGAEIRREQTRWMSRRNACGEDRACLRRRYQEQIALLESYFNN
ncbi:MAG: hypothetical protein K2Z25_00430 [Beijerinckiaceae bacterium]|nr:hypothetical protein [Beijerinckiaceae bacterium]